VHYTIGLYILFGIAFSVRIVHVTEVCLL